MQLKLSMACVKQPFVGRLLSSNMLIEPARVTFVSALSVLKIWTATSVSGPLSMLCIALATFGLVPESVKLTFAAGVAAMSTGALLVKPYVSR